MRMICTCLCRRAKIFTKRRKASLTENRELDETCPNDNKTMLSSRRSRRVCVVTSLAPRVYTDGATGNGHWMRAFPWTILISRTPRHGDAMDAIVMASAAEGEGGAGGKGEARMEMGANADDPRPPACWNSTDIWLTRRAFYPIRCATRYAYMYIRESRCHLLKLRGESFSILLVSESSSGHVKQKVWDSILKWTIELSIRNLVTRNRLRN